MRRILILGPGCAKCQKLAENTEQAARALGLDYEIFKVSDIQAIIGFGVMMTPALVVDDQVKVAGRVPSVDELKGMLGQGE